MAELKNVRQKEIFSMDRTGTPTSNRAVADTAIT